jgi:hypothetical protein
MSFLSVEPQSRAVLESHNNSLLAQFDTQVSIIADRYLAFFQERSIKKILQVIHITLIIRSSGRVLRQPSQSLCQKSDPIYPDRFPKASHPYGDSIARRKTSMPQSTLVVNQLQREQHGLK